MVCSTSGRVDESEMMSGERSILKGNGEKSVEILLQSDSTDGLVHFQCGITEEFRGVSEGSLSIEIEMFETSKTKIGIRLSDIERETFIEGTTKRNTILSRKIGKKEIPRLRKGMSVNNARQTRLRTTLIETKSHIATLSRKSQRLTIRTTRTLITRRRTKRQNTNVVFSTESKSIEERRRIEIVNIVIRFITRLGQMISCARRITRSREHQVIQRTIVLNNKQTSLTLSLSLSLKQHSRRCYEVSNRHPSLVDWENVIQCKRKGN